jgi:hypothetical protein
MKQHPRNVKVGMKCKCDIKWKTMRKKEELDKKIQKGGIWISFL